MREKGKSKKIFFWLKLYVILYFEYVIESFLFSCLLEVSFLCYPLLVIPRTHISTCETLKLFLIFWILNIRSCLSTTFAWLFIFLGISAHPLYCLRSIWQKFPWNPAHSGNSLKISFPHCFQKHRKAHEDIFCYKVKILWKCSTSQQLWPQPTRVYWNFWIWSYFLM